MKLKNKLIISFLMIMAIPLFLFCVFSVVLVRYQFVIIQNSYGVSAEFTDFFPNNNKLFSQLMNNVQLKLQDEVEENNQLLEDKKMLEKYCEKEVGEFINVVVLKDEDIYYSYKPLKQEEIEAIERESQETIDAADDTSTVYLSRENTILGKAADSEFADGSRAQVYTLVKVNQWLPELKQLAVQFVLAMIFILFLTACIFTTWIYRSVVQPIRELRLATEKIKSGNLDFVVNAASNDEMGQLCTDFEKMRQHLKESAEEKIRFDNENRELISNISHDLKTPLTSIITYTDLLKDEDLDKEKRAQYLETLDQKAQRLKILIEDLFEMSKASSGNITMNLQEVEVISLMKQTLLELEDKIDAANLMIRRNFPEHKVLLMLDSERTFRVFDNLILNMTKYAMPHTRAYIDIVDLEQSVQIIFRNMSANEINVDVDELTERFVRGDQARHTEGSGLGLAIAKSFVELQGGTLDIHIDGDLFKVILTFNK